METPDHVDDPTMELETKQSKQSKESNQSNQSNESNESPPGDEAQTLSKMSDLIRNMSSNDDIIEGSPNISLLNSPKKEEQPMPSLSTILRDSMHFSSGQASC